MHNSYKMIAEGRKDELWRKHCGYLSLSRKEFRDIQTRLMLEQINLLGSSRIGRKLMRGQVPTSLEEFRRVTPLTEYADYGELLKDKKEEDLPEKPHVWARTSGKSSDLGPKWIPYTKAMYDGLSEPGLAAMIMSSCTHPGEVRIEHGDKFLMATAPPPYLTGHISRSVEENLEVVFLPDLDRGEIMPFGERIALGFKLAMREGLDYFFGVSAVLARMGEQFEQQTSNTSPSKELLDLRTLWRLLNAVVISKIQKRNILPKDIWHLKGIITSGTDTEIYKDRIEHYWGKKPLEGYACTEAGNLAMQSWNYKGMTFFPEICFLEFISLDEYQKNKEEPSYIPKTLLYDELDMGIYELVLSNINGGILVRYRIGDFFEVIANEDEQIGSVLPQVKFYSRCDDLIDLGSFIRLTERDIWRAVETTGIKYVDWVAQKQITATYPTLHLFIELVKHSDVPEELVQEKIRQSFSDRFTDYNDMKEILGIEPVVVTLLPCGAFDAYMKAKVAAGADLAHIKPPHMKPSDAILRNLISSSIGSNP